MTDKTARRIARALERIAEALETQKRKPIPMMRNASITGPSRHRIY